MQQLYNNYPNSVNNNFREFKHASVDNSVALHVQSIENPPTKKLEEIAVPVLKQVKKGTTSVEV